MINNDIVTFKKIVRLFDKNNLLFLLNETSGVNLFAIMRQMKKHPIMKDFYLLLTGKESFTLKEFTITLKEFFKEKKFQDESAEFLMKAKGKYLGGKSDVNDIKSNNQYFDLQTALGNIGQFDCTNISFDEGLFILLKHNEEMDKQERQIKAGRNG